MRSSTRTRPIAWICALLVLVVPAFLSADQNPATDNVPRVLPYQGYLHVNGKALNATGADAIHVRFSLYDGPEGSDTLVYEEDETVEVFAGRFSVLLGPTGLGGTAMATVVAGADELYLGIALRNDPGNPTDDVELAGRQLITPMPYALWSTKATNLDVASNLTVGGTATITGTATTGALQVNGDATVTGAARSESLGVGMLAPATAGDLNVDNDATVGNKLTVNAGAVAPETPTTIKGFRWQVFMSTSSCSLSAVVNTETMTPMSRSVCFVTHSVDFDTNSGHVFNCYVGNDGANWNLNSACLAVQGTWDCVAKCLEWDW